MTSTAHSLVAVSIAVTIPDPTIAYPLSFFSNYILDALPHWDFGLNWRKKNKSKFISECVLDVLLSYFLALILHRLFFTNINLNYILINVFLSQLADWLEIPYLILNWHFPPFSYFYKIQHIIHRRQDLPWGLTTQILVCIPLLYLIVKAI